MNRPGPLMRGCTCEPIPRHAMPTPTPSRPIWFPAKRYGWGWGRPVAWQGWAVLLIWIAVLAAVIAPLVAGRHWVAEAVFLVGWTAALIGVCYARGEPPRWRWGDRRP